MSAVQQVRGLRRQLRPLLVGLEPCDNWRAALEIGGIVAALIAIEAAAFAAERTGYWGLFVPLALAVAVVQVRMAILHHEAVHRLLFSNPALNDIVGLRIIGASIGALPKYSRRSHLSHHAYLGAPWDLERSNYAPPASAPAFVRWLARKAFGIEPLQRLVRLLRHRPAAADSPPPHRSDWINLAVMQMAILGGLAALGSAEHYLILWIAPLMTVSRALMGVRALAEHLPFPGPEGTRYLTTFDAGPLERLLLAPLGFQYHAEHHLLPSIPSWRLWRAAAAIRSHAEFPRLARRRAGYGAALREFYRAGGAGV